jgi:hypothetical protein
VVFGDPVGLVQAAGGAAILAGIALNSLPLLLPLGAQRWVLSAMAAVQTWRYNIVSAATPVTDRDNGPQRGPGLIAPRGRTRRLPKGHPPQGKAIGWPGLPASLGTRSLRTHNFAPDARR